MKATKVDGIYNADPVKDPDAVRYQSLTYTDALTQQLGVMDAAAFSLCMENDIPIIVFDFFKSNSMVEIFSGDASGTLVNRG